MFPLYLLRAEASANNIYSLFYFCKDDDTGGQKTFKLGFPPSPALSLLAKSWHLDHSLCPTDATWLWNTYSHFGSGLI